MYIDSSKISNEKEEAIEETKTRKADMQTQKKNNNKGIAKLGF